MDPNERSILRAMWTHLDNKMEGYRLGRKLDAFMGWPDTAKDRLHENADLREAAWRAHKMLWGGV